VKNGENKLLFATDTYMIKIKLQGLTQAILECNYVDKVLEENLNSGAIHKVYYGRVLESHMSLKNLKFWLSKNDLSKLKEIRLIHLSDKNADKELMLKEIQSTTGVPVYVE